MLGSLTPRHITDYQQHGFLVVEDLLDATELQHWRDTVQAAVDQRVANGQTGGGDAYYQRVFTQCIRLADDHPTVREMVYARDLAAMAGRLAGVGGLRCWHDQALFKGPYGNPTGWHLDVPFWSFNHAQSITVWIALDDATVANGCLWYLPGTHKQARFELTPIGSDLGELFQQYPEWSKLTPVPAPVRAGGAVFHNGLIAHAAGCNLTGSPRRAMTMAWMPDGSLFNGRRNILPERLINRLKPGDRLDDADVNPLLWSA